MSCKKLKKNLKNTYHFFQNFAEFLIANYLCLIRRIWFTTPLISMTIFLETISRRRKMHMTQYVY